jgi:hypothetical protein
MFTFAIRQTPYIIVIVTGAPEHERPHWILSIIIKYVYLRGFRWLLLIMAHIIPIWFCM